MENSKKWKKVLFAAGLPVLLAALLLLKWGRLDGVTLLLRTVLAAFGYAAAAEDIREKRVANKLVLLMLAAWAIILLPQFFYRRQAALGLLFTGAVGFLIAGVLFLLVYLVARGGLGGGDVKFMAVAGLYLGFAGVMPAMLYGAVLAGVTAVVLLLTKKIGRKDSFPLIPFLYAGIMLTLFIQ